MSETSKGPGWWVASDGKWYPPEQAHPDQAQSQAPSPAPVAAPVAPSPVGAEAPQGPGWWQATDGRWYPPQPGQLSAKEQIRLDKANRKAMRPWYKKKRWWALFVILIIVILIIVIVASAAKSVNDAVTKVHTVVYSVAGSGTATTITYDTLQSGSGQNGEAQDTNVPLPWSKTIHASGLITAYTVSATVGSDGGTVTCTITVDGKVVNTNTANGAFATATCNS
jgi:hypothetical protein